MEDVVMNLMKDKLNNGHSLYINKKRIVLVHYEIIEKKSKRNN